MRIIENRLDIMTINNKHKVLSNTHWELEIAWLPHRCEISHRLVWLEFAYHGYKIIPGFNDTLIVDYWISRKHFTFFDHN